MQRPPRGRKDGLLTAGLLTRAYLHLGAFETLAAMSAFFFVLTGAGWQWGQALSPDDVVYRQATAACLTAIVLMQVVNVHLCRSRTASLFARPLLDNRLITAGITAELALILAIDYTAVGNRLFGTAPPGPGAWLVVVPFAIGMLVVEEVRKGIVRWRGPSRGAASELSRQTPGITGRA
jgi:magnesium-transporting ATPase (P-type)